MSKAVKTTEKGFSLLELLLVIGVGALLLIAGLATYRIVTEGNNVNEAIRILNSAKIGIQTLYQNQANYGADGTDITDIVVDGGVFPARNIVGGTPLDPWREATVVESVDDANGVGYTITFQNLPQAACGKLGTAFTPTTDSDFVSVDINGNGADTNPTVANVRGDCTAGDTNDITWRFL